jgi:RNA polymerase sigma factor (sigma-70 family)
METVRIGQCDVYEVLVREHEAMLGAYVLSIVHEPAVAEDICQEAFIQGFHQLATLKQKERFPAWLRTIARNLALAELARQKREVAIDPRVMEGMEDVFCALDRNPDGSLWQERAKKLAECVESLPAPLNACCKLHYFESNSAKQIAEILEISLAAVLKRLERARLAIGACVERRLVANDR